MDDLSLCDCGSELCAECSGCLDCSECDCYGSFSYKAPKRSDRRHHVGVEIEFFSDWGRNDIAKKLEKEGLGSYCYLKEDGSLDHDEGIEGHELAVLCRETQYHKILKKVCKVLKSVQATVNSTCGLHVHLDMRYRNKQKVFQNLVLSQDILFAMQPRSRRRNQYCQRTRTTNFEEATRSQYRPAVNSTAFSKHKTIEIRLHSGTTNYKKISNWINLLLKITAKHKTMTNNVTTISMLSKQVRLSPRLKRYIATRVALFNTEDQLVADNQAA